MSVKVLKFSATWCGPCKIMGPIFEKVSKLDKFKNIDFKSYDIEDDEEGVELVEKFSVRNIPTIIIVDENDNQMKKIIGAVQENELINLIEETVQHEL